MESPLDFFRRNQKTMLPVIAIGCMVAFVVLPGLLSMLSEKHQQGSERNPVLFKWQGGDLTQRELQQEINDHERLSHLYTRVSLQKAMLSSPDLANSQQLMNAYYGVFQNQFRQSFPGPTNLNAAADAKIFDQLAKELGIFVSDQRVNDFLDDLCGVPAIGPDGKPTGAYQTIVPAKNFDAIMQDMAKTDPGFTQTRLFDLLKRMFSRMEVERIFSLQNVYSAETPLARWENYRRIRQRASIQAIPVQVSEFVNAIPDPKEDELQKFFDANKERLPDPNSAEVGLRTPLRASFQLAHIDMERLVDSYKPSIDNKAISDYYEKNKEARYVKPKLPAIEPMKSGETKSDETKATDPAAPMTPEAKEAPKTEAPKTEPAKTEPAKTEPEAPKTETPKKQSSLTRDGFLPVNFQADAKKEPAKDAKAAEPAKTEPAKTEPAKTEPAKSDTAKEPAKGEEAKTEPAKTEPVEYIPLANVEGEIRTILATEKANAQADVLMQKIEDEMAAYKKSRDRAFIKAEDATKVKFDDFDMVKATAGIDPTIKAENLTLVSRDQFLKHPISGTQATFLQGAPILGDVVYSEKFFPLYEPIRPRSFAGRYIFWKTEQRGDEVPSLSDKATREKAIAAWKMVEARKDAKKQADRYAEIARDAIKANKDGKEQTLLELFNAKVLPVAPTEISGFSWITLPTQQGERPTVSKVSGLDKAGNELMKEIFGLKQGQVGVAPNQPQTLYYVVQVTQADDLTKLRDAFMQDVRTAEGWRQFEGANFDQQITEARSFYERLRERYKMVPTGNQPFIVGAEQQ